MQIENRVKVGQRLVAGIKGTTAGKELREFVQRTKIGNYILFRENIINRVQVTNLCASIQQIVKEETGFDAFITIDQEGGRVTRLSDDCVNMPGQMALAAIGDKEVVFEAGKLTGQQLRKLGINFNLAPVVDINSNPKNPVIGVRSFGDCPEMVANYAVEMMQGLQQGGVLTAAKHFPGHGDTSEDSHLTLPKVAKKIEEVYACELVPYQALIKAGVDAIMMTHILYPALETEEIPATMSRKIVTDLLKSQLKFHGLILSDCMEMNAIKEYYGTVNGVLQAVKAGVDLVLISHTTNLMVEASDRLTQALAQGELSMEEMDASVHKILLYKNKVVTMQAPEFSYQKAKIMAKRLVKESITLVQMPTQTLPSISRNSVFLGCCPFLTTKASDHLESGFHFADDLARKFSAKSVHTSKDPIQSEIDAYVLEVKQADLLILGTYNGHLYSGQKKLLRALASLHKPMIVVALGNPYDLMKLPKGVYGIAAYEYSKTSLEALLEVLKGEKSPKAVLPVMLN